MATIHEGAVVRLLCDEEEGAAAGTLCRVLRVYFADDCELLVAPLSQPSAQMLVMGADVEVAQ